MIIVFWKECCRVRIGGHDHFLGPCHSAACSYMPGTVRVLLCGNSCYRGVCLKVDSLFDSLGEHVFNELVWPQVASRVGVCTPSTFHARNLQNG